MFASSAVVFFGLKLHKTDADEQNAQRRPLGADQGTVQQNDRENGGRENFQLRNNLRNTWIWNNMSRVKLVIDYFLSKNRSRTNFIKYEKTSYDGGKYSGKRVPKKANQS